MKAVAIMGCILSVLVATSGVTRAADKPKITLASDGFPTGQATPEGVACDLARAFINRDVALFAEICLPPMGDAKSAEDYRAFLDQTAQSIRQAALAKVQGDDPKEIGKVFAARALSRSGPASYAYAVFGFQDVKFVDVGAFLVNGKRYLNRTLVIQKVGGTWYAMPAPDIYPLLSAGLNEESASTQDFRDVYASKH